MSYIVHVWESPVPSSVQEAEQIHRQLAAQTTPQNPRFIELAHRLTQRFPCMSTMGDNEAEDAVWTDAPLDGCTPHPCFALGIRTDALSEVMPLLVAEARALGLVLYDMQDACVHLPDGQALGLVSYAASASLATSAATSLDDQPLESKKQLLDLLKDGLHACMGKHGFQPASFGFAKKSKESTQEVAFEISFYGEAGSRVRLFVHIEPKFKVPVKKAMDKHATGTCSLVLPILFKACKLPSFVPASKAGVEFTVTRPSEVIALTTELAECFNRTVFGMLLRCESIQQLGDEFEADRLRSERTLVSYTQADLLIAFLTNRSAYEVLIDKAINDETSEYRRKNIVALKTALSEQESRP